MYKNTILALNIVVIKTESDASFKSDRNVFLNITLFWLRVNKELVKVKNDNGTWTCCKKYIHV